MKSLIVSLCAVILSVSAVVAQPKDEKFERIRAQKVAYITQKLDLTAEEAQKFWPVYNEFESKMFALHKPPKEGERPGPPDFSKMSDEELKQFFADKFKEEEDMLKLKKEYHEKYMKVLPAKKVALLYEAEFSFRHELIDRLKDKRQGPDPEPGGPMPGR